MKWSGGIALKGLRRLVPLIVIASLFAAPAVSGTPDSERTKADAAAKDLYQQNIMEYAKDGPSLVNNFAKPVLENTDMFTLDGKKKFTPGTTLAAGSNAVLRVGVFPNPSTGDIKLVTVEQDLALTGTIDTVSSYPTAGGTDMIAGFCLDGFIQCAPNTYSSSCSFWKWVVDSSTPATAGRISASKGFPLNDGTFANYGVADLSGCYCINNHCSASNSTTILNTDGLAGEVGGGLAALVLSAKNDMAILQGSISGGIVSYFGRVVTGGGSTGILKTSTADPGYATLTSKDLQNYYGTGDAGMDAAADAEIKRQAANPKSIYSVYKGLSDQISGTTITKTCTNLRTGLLSYSTFTQATDKGLDGSWTVVVGLPYYTTIRSKDGGKSNFYVNAWYDSSNGADRPTTDHVQCEIDLQVPSISTGFEVQSLDASASIYGDGCIPMSGSANVVRATSISQGLPIKLFGGDSCVPPGAQVPHVTCQLSVSFMSQDYAETLDAGCLTIENDPTCKLKNELNDNRPMVQDYVNQSGQAVSEVCLDFVGQLRTVRRCHDWWKQDKTYICTKPSGPDYSTFFNKYQAKAKEVQTSATLSAPGTMTWTEGGVTKTATVFTPTTTTGLCQAGCKTSTPTVDTRITNTSAVIDTNTAAALKKSSNRIAYKTCIGANWDVCPVDTKTGEAIVQDCTCLQDFQEALAAITALDVAASDSICSQKPPPK